MEIMIIKRSTALREVYALGPWAARLPYYHCGISCGRGSELFDVSRTYFDLPSYCGTSRESTYLVQAQGDSMTPVIEDGDLMVVDRDREPQNGDIILACVDNGDVVAKYYYIDKAAGEVRLTPANTAYPERVLRQEEHKVVSLGVVKYVIRNISRKPVLNIMKMPAMPTITALTNEEGYPNGTMSIKSKRNIIGTNTGLHTDTPLSLKAEANKEQLGQMFKAQFKGAGGHPDYFTNNLLEDLRLEWTDRQIAMIANMIYESGWLAGKPDSFTAWYRHLCQMIGRTFHPGYHPCKLNPSEGLKRRFYYLKKG